MESFSTPHRPLVPVAANACTLVVLVLATWWSGAQRPAGDNAAGLQSKANDVPSVKVHAAGTTAPADDPGLATPGLPRATSWQPTLNTGAKSVDATTLQPVGFGAVATKTAR